MDTPTLARPRTAEPGLAPFFKRYWRWAALLLLALAPRIYLLRVFDVELSNDGFDAVNTLRLLQVQGPAAIPREWVDRFILHPLYMFLLYALRLLVPASFDFYFAARFLSTLLACVAILLMFEFVRRAFEEYAAWAAALLLAFAPTFLWESASILSSTLFLALYLGVLLALVQGRYRRAAFLAFLATLTRYEGGVLFALTLFALFWRDVRRRQFDRGVWFACLGLVLAVPLLLMATGWLTTGNALELIGAQSMASLWLRFLAPGDFFKRALFFLTQYPALLPQPVVWLGVAGAGIALWQSRRQGLSCEGRLSPVALLLLTSVLYVFFFEVLVWFNYTTLEVRFLMYPGLPLLVFAGVALASVSVILSKSPVILGGSPVILSKSPGILSKNPVILSKSPVILSGAKNLPDRHEGFIATRRFFASLRMTTRALTVLVLLVLLWMSYQQAVAGMRFVYNMHTSQREVADELAQIIPANAPTNTMIYAGVEGALDLYARQRGLVLAFSYFRYAPEDHPEQYLVDRQVRYIVYPVGNAFAVAKFPYLAHFEAQTHSGVTFQPLTQFSTSADNQMYSVWALDY